MVSAFTTILWIGSLEKTILQSYKKGANIRWWLSRENCPEVLQQFKYFFDKAFTREIPYDTSTCERIGELAHIIHNGTRYSRMATHEGNSLISYYPSREAAVPVVGSIQKIVSDGQHVYLTIKRQALPPSGTYDPFIRYPSFPANLYSAKMVDNKEDRIPVSSIVSHVARFLVPGTEIAVVLTLSRVSL